MNLWIERIALLVPLVGVAGMMATASAPRVTGGAAGGQLAGTTWRLPIEGYDPRDPVFGHYLAFRFAAEVDVRDQGWCLLGSPEEPVVLPLDDETACDATLASEHLQERHRYQIPQAAGTYLESALRDGENRFTVEVMEGAGGLQFGELYLNGTPWTEVWAEEEPAASKGPSPSP